MSNTVTLSTVGQDYKAYIFEVELIGYEAGKVVLLSVPEKELTKLVKEVTVNVHLAAYDF